jgi:hypothetical protein
MPFDFFNKPAGEESSAVPHRPASDSDPVPDASLNESINPYKAPASHEIPVREVVKKLDRVVSAIEDSLKQGGLGFEEFYGECFSLLSQEGIAVGEFSQQGFMDTFQLVEQMKRYANLKPLLGDVVKGFKQDFIAHADLAHQESVREQQQEYLEARLTIRRRLHHKASEGILDAQDIIEEVGAYLQDRYDISPQRKETLQKYMQTEIANDFSYIGIIGRYPAMSPLLFAPAEFLESDGTPFACEAFQVDGTTLNDAIALLAQRH